MSIARNVSFLLLLAVPALASAQTLPQALDAKSAQAIIAGCVAHSTGKRQGHAIVVVDTGGRLIAALRMDGNGSGMTDFAMAKAEAAAAWGFSTAQMGEGAKETPGFAAAPNVVTVAGGLPIFLAEGKKSRIGAVGVSGEAPTDDEACAAKGITAAGFLPSRG